MNLFINREGPVPIHDQLCAQLAQMIAAGTLAPGQRLPSIRALAQRTQLHHNTILGAYQALASRGLLVIKEGSGARVADLAALQAGPALDTLARAFVAQARTAGFGEAEILAACRRALEPAPVERLVVVNQHEDLQEMYLHELGRHVKFPMIGATLEEVGAMASADRQRSLFMTSTNNAPALAPLLGDARPPQLFKLSPGDEMLAQAKALPADEAVAVVSGSSRFLFLNREMLAGARDEGTLLEASTDDPGRVASVLRTAKLVVCDSATYDKLTHPRKYMATLLAPAFFDDLALVLPPGAVTSV
ncbi:MAG: transcriptional regulator, GntR family [Cyanobacteria bacterium RYN_339]|nr:transcriptional regulator, GntR family [Cyanobacteria bacterium RYN_339]